ncbi:MAG: TrmH family RNA methyltransferase [Candidatus Pacearchaeota archaeon]
MILNNPKNSHNVAGVLRAASCFGFEQVWFTGDRVSIENGERLPREERMKGYAEVDLYQFDYPFDCFSEDVTPVAIELVENSESLITFEHPENAVYVFGPEDGSISQVFKKHCHRFVTIPTRHCTNLAAAVYITMYDRIAKRVQNGLQSPPELCENRGWIQYTEREEL